MSEKLRALERLKSTLMGMVEYYRVNDLVVDELLEQLYRVLQEIEDEKAKETDEDKN
ncbi:MAG: hypothetical protein U0X91_22125 [Spirosomataceae bacterium]